MGYKHKIRKDVKTRLFFNKKEIECVLLNYFNNLDLNKRHKIYIFYKFLRKFHLNSSSSRIVNICIKTGRSSWVLRHFRYSRMTFKEFAEFGRLNGVRRANW